ncbi:MAG: glycosyltransferase family 4 protein, partial [Acidimicrobiales bacterium]
DVVERWRRSGHEVLVLTSEVRVSGVPEPQPAERSSVWRDLKLYWEDHEILDPPPLRRLAWERSNLACLERALSEFRPDVASAWAMGAMSLGLLGALGRRHVPVVSVICDEWPVYGPVVDPWMRALSHRPRLGRLVRALTRLETSLPPLDSLGPSCFVSAHLRNVCRDQSEWAFPDSTVVYSGIERRDFPFVERSGAWRWRLLYVGRIDPRKGIDTLLRAFARCPQDARLDVVGRGDDRHLDELRHLAGELGVTGRARFTSSPRSELGAVYAGADVLVFPAVWEEPFGLVPVEAMACGTPVVATRVGGAAEFLADERNCLAFAPSDVDGLVAALHRLADDSALRSELVSGGVRTAADLDVDRLAEDLDAWHRSAVEGTARPAQRRPPGAHADPSTK